MEMESVMAERPANINTICRLCLSERLDSLKSIFDDVLSPNMLPQKIHLLIQVQVNKNDKLSTMVCNDCIIRLDTWFAYKKQCHRNQAKLVEWLNKSSGQSVVDVNIHIKAEPVDIDVNRQGIPIKTEYTFYNEMVEEEFNDLPSMLPSYAHNSDHIYLEDLPLEVADTDENSPKCSDCGKVFHNANNRKRHQNMMHRKDKRAQMVEIKKPDPPNETLPDQNSGESTTDTGEKNIENIEQNFASVTENTDTSVQNLNNTEENTTAFDMDITPEMHTVAEATPKIDTTAATTHKGETNAASTPEMDTTAETPKEDSATSQNQSVPENKPQEETPSKTNQNESTTNKEGSVNIKERLLDETEILQEKPSDEGQNKSNEKIEEVINDQQKIEFAAGLKLVQKETSSAIETELLSKIELSYIEKCKAMVSMFHTLQCACHNLQHKTIRHLLSHLRETRIWFPLFTCYSCMISFTDRSTFTRHYTKCPRSQLETLIKLSYLRKRTEIKTRLYQNYKCTRCNFLYSFHEDFCKHIDEDHASGSPPFYCSCRFVFDSLEEYKTHCYTSCVVSYYCDICFITTDTIEEFVKHSEETHDTSEGFVLLQEYTYTPRGNSTHRSKEIPDEENVVDGKRERRKSTINYEPIPQDSVDIPTKVLRQMVLLDNTPTTAHEWNKQSANCPVCKKVYSSLNNMIRHYRTHIERKEIELPQFQDGSSEGSEDLYSCPECGGVYSPSSWKKHIEDNHPPISCTECDKTFQFQSELDQHRSVHLNLKVYRDSKTHSYKTAILSPGEENNEGVGEVVVMCEICDAMFKSKEELKLHKLNCHDINMSRASSSMDNFEMPHAEESKSLLQTTMEVEEKVDQNDSVDINNSTNEKFPCDSCGRIYASTKTLKEHVMNKHGVSYVKTEFPKKCDYCDKVCTTNAALARHTQVHEKYNPNKKNEYPKKCEYCDKICTTGAGFHLHTQMHERMSLNDIKKEKTVLKTEPIKEKIRTVQDVQEDESYHTCKRCFKVFATKFKLKEHMKSHGINPSKPGPKPKNRKVLCDLCHVSLESADALSKHKAEEHCDELDGMPTLRNEMEVDESNTLLLHTCDICEETFASNMELNEHKQTHTKLVGSKPKNSQVYCKYCKISFDSVNELTKHMHLEHGESAKPKITKEKPVDTGDGKPFKCPICAKGFASHGAMTAHFGWHKRSGTSLETPKENTPQATAAVRFEKKAKVLKKFVDAAANKQEPIEPPEFQCTTCFMELPNDTALQIHMLEKHQGLDSLMLIPRCNTCNQDFATQEDYETHKRFHDFLERQKKHEQQVQAQQQIQTPIIQSVQSVADVSQNTPKRHPCNWCNSVFSRSDTLNTHIKQNHKEHVKTEFECTYCDRVFDKQNSLTIHLKVHEKQKNVGTYTATVVSGGGKVYSCSICSRGFSYPKDLRMHTINDHPF